MITITWAWQLVPSLAYQLFPELGLTQTTFTLLFTAPVLIAVFVAIPGGALGDRYGIRSMVAIAAFAAALGGLLRAFLPDFTGMFLMMCLIGVGFGIAVPNLPKLVGVWFPPHLIGAASGISMCGMGVGFSLGLYTGPLFPDWRAAFIAVGIIGLVVAILWTIFARTCPPGVKLHRVKMIPAIKASMKNKNIWMVAFAMFLLQAGLLPFQANLPSAMESIHQFSPQAAGAMAATVSFGLLLGNFILPPFSDRVGLRKPFIITGVIIGAFSFFFAWKLAPSFISYALLMVGGFIMGVAPPLLFAAPAELTELGHEYVGGASGIIVSMMNLGGFLMPLLVISPLLASGTLSAYTTGFMVAMLFVALMIVPVIFLKETGRRARYRKNS